MIDFQLFKDFKRKVSVESSGSVQKGRKMHSEAVSFIGGTQH